MSGTSIFESTFAQSDKTDAILVVEGKKLHVNKAHLSFQSDYFNTLFNGEFKEKSMTEIPIEDVKYEELATLLSLVGPNPIKPAANACEKLLEYADRFMLPGVKPYIECVLIASDIFCLSKICIGGEYGLDDLIDNGISSVKMSTTPEMSIYESTFAQSDKTDAILVIEGKKLYVNRAHLSFHSDYFNALFNGEFKEKSMPEIPIEDVKYKEFATLLSLAHPKPIKPKADDYEILLEYADRFMLPGAKLYIELVLIASDIYCVNKIWIGGKYGLDDLIDNGLSAAESEHWSFREIVREKKFKNLPEAAQLKIALKMVVFQ